MMEMFQTSPICQLNNGRGSRATGWVCSPDGYIMGPGHTFTEKTATAQTIDFRNSIDTAEIYDVYYQQKSYKASLVYAYYNQKEHMDFAVLKMNDQRLTYSYYPITLQCEQKAAIHMAGYGDVLGSDVLDPAEGHYVSKAHFKDCKGHYLLKVTCPDAVQYGFSGSPVYVDSSNAVIGMQINSTKIALDPKNQRSAEKNSIFAIPIQLILQKFPFMQNYLVLEGTGKSECIIPKQLIKDISEGNCILFVGAGCSLDAGLPGWNGLTTALLEGTRRRIPIDDATMQELERLQSEGKLLILAKFCRSKLQESGFGQCMKEILGNYDRDNATAHRILSKIKFKAILTTNYDSLIEDFNADDSHPVYTAQDFGDLDLSLENVTPIVKIHGSLDKTGSIVLTSTDIRKVLFGNIKFRERLKELFRNSTVLFVGYSFEDPNISLLLQDLLTSDPTGTRLHYALMPNSSSIMNDYLLEDMSVVVLSYKTRWNTFAPLHNVLNDLVASLPPHALKL